MVVLVVVVVVMIALEVAIVIVVLIFAKKKLFFGALVHHINVGDNVGISVGCGGFGCIGGGGGRGNNCLTGSSSNWCAKLN